MFSRLQDHRDRRKRRFDEARAEGKAESINEGKAEGIAEGEAKGKAEGIAEGEAKGKAEVYQELAEWNTRRLAAAARNEPFTEPFPAPPEPPKVA